MQTTRKSRFFLFFVMAISASLCTAADGGNAGDIRGGGVFQTGKVRDWIKPVFVAALLASSGQAIVHNASNDALPYCFSDELSESQGNASELTLPVADSPWQMATAYFIPGGDCTVRCVATRADWLGPLQAICADFPGCADMELQGAFNCVVSSSFVDQFRCTISMNTTALPAPEDGGEPELDDELQSDDDVIV